MSERWLGGRPTIVLGSDDGQYRRWLGGASGGDLIAGTFVGVSAGGYIPLDVHADGWLITDLTATITADAVLVQVDAVVRADGYLVEGRRRFPLPPPGRQTPRPPIVRADPTIP